MKRKGKHTGKIGVHHIGGNYAHVPDPHAHPTHQKANRAHGMDEGMSPAGCYEGQEGCEDTSGEMMNGEEY